MKIKEKKFLVISLIFKLNKMNEFLIFDSYFLEESFILNGFFKIKMYPVDLSTST